jgi:acyl-CoA reductase-like NAD-dependent aldehyde dehydrogenase
VSVTTAPVPLFVAGAWMTSEDVIDVRAPGDGRLVGQTYEATAEMVETAIVAGLASQPALRAQAPYERSAILRRVSELILDRAAGIATLLSAENGKPVRDARTEVERSALTFRVAAEEAERIGGEVLDLGINKASRGRLGITRRFPAGLVAGITPFNLPVSLSSHKLAPAMAVGCPIVLKIPSNAPLAMLEVARIIEEAGVPAGSVSIMAMPIAVGDQLVTDERFKVLSFTGSPRVGWSMKGRAGKKRTLLELGGNAGALVDASADIEWAATRCAAGAFKYAGQTCISVQRVYVHADVYEEFLGLFVAATQKLRVGDPAKEDTDVGPVIDEASARRVRGLIADVTAQGARVLVGGPGEGNYIPPTIIVDAPPTAAVCREEAFGPVAVVERVEDFASGLAALNDSTFGLQAGVFTADVGKAFDAFNELEVGGVIVNDSPTYRVDHMPYGGVKDSGLGREGVRYAMQEMSEVRLLVFAQPG